MSALSEAIGPHDARPARDGNALLLAVALDDAGVELWAYDAAVLVELTTGDTAVARVVAGWIVRARLNALVDATAIATTTAARMDRVPTTDPVAMSAHSLGARAVSVNLADAVASLGADWSAR